MPTHGSSPNACFPHAEPRSGATNLTQPPCAASSRCAGRRSVRNAVQRGNRILAPSLSADLCLERRSFIDAGRVVLWLPCADPNSADTSAKRPRYALTQLTEPGFVSSVSFVSSFWRGSIFFSSRWVCDDSPGRTRMDRTASFLLSQDAACDVHQVENPASSSLRLAQTEQAIVRYQYIHLNTIVHP